MVYYIVTVISMVIAIILYIATIIAWAKHYRKDTPDMKWALQKIKSAQDSKSRTNARHVRSVRKDI